MKGRSAVQIPPGAPFWRDVYKASGKRPDQHRGCPLSFFFSKAKPRKANRAPAGKQNGRPATQVARGIKKQAPALHRLGCSACPLNTAQVSTPKMVPTLGEGPIYFLAEAPGRDEDENSGKPLTGPSGQLLEECIPVGDHDHCSYDNVINCRPPKNRTPEFAEIECCRPRRWKYIEEAKPLLIVGLGAVPLRWMLNSSDLAGMRGRFFAVKVGNHRCWFMPTYHPSFILRIAYDKNKPLNSKFGHCFRMDIKRAFDAVRTLEQPQIDDAVGIRSNIKCFDGSTGDFDKLIGLLGEATKAKRKAVDLETKGLRPFSAGAAIMTMAFSFADTNFAFALDHPKAKWSVDQRMKILLLVEALLKDDTIKIAHNVPFELEWFIWLFGKEVVNHKVWHCTQMQAHFIDERRGKQGAGDDNRRAVYQSLDFLCKQYFGIAYKSIFKLNKKDMSKSDLGETLIYNGADTKMTLKLFFIQKSQLKELDLQDSYLDSIQRQPSVALMQSIGLGVDQVEVKRTQKQLEGQIDQLVTDINNLKVVKAYIRDKKEFNPASNGDVLAIFKDYLKRTEVLIDPKRHEVHDFNISSEAKRKFDDEGGGARYSVDRKVLDQIDHPLAQMIVQYRNKSKMKSTYVDNLVLGKGSVIYPDGKIHCNINTTFTETGRTSSDEPNTQNFPQRKDAWVRKQVVASPGNVLVAFDYGQLEACGAAVLSRDKALVKALWDDYDIHMAWAIKVAAKYPPIVGGSMSDPKVAKTFRSIIKNKMVFPAIYGAQASSIAGYLNMPEDIADDLMDEFWDMFRGLADWQKRLMTSYYDKGYVESPTGRRHSYPLTRNQAINFPIQCWAAEVVCSSMNELSSMAVESGDWNIHPILNIHDDLTFDIPDKDSVLEEAIETIYRVMLSPPYKVNVPLSVKASIGKNWYEMAEIGSFWSHKDLE